MRKQLGKYLIEAELGRGGMGVVYRAHQPSLERTVAIKLLSSDLIGDPDGVRRFRLEARAIARLNHPNIVQVFDIEEEENLIYLVMEFVDGESLDGLISKQILPESRCLKIVADIADALHFAHEKGIVHRDVKPENVFLTKDGYAKVLDFGLARQLSASPEEAGNGSPTAALTGEGAVLGTVAYMSPEQARGLPADHRSDQFSLGIVLYEMLAASRPFQRDTAAETLTAIIREEPEPLETAPAPVRMIVERCLSKEPVGRYESTRDLARDLGTWRQRLEAGTAGFPAAGAGAPRKLAPSPKKRLFAGVAALAAVLLAAAGVRLVPRLWSPRPAGGSPPIRSVAVLPFENLGHDPSQDYFVDGMHDALITDLAKLGVLRVTSRSSVMPYKGKPKSMKEIAHELGVDALIEGSVLRAGNKVRITAQLILGASDEHVWAENYDRNVEDVLGLLTDVSRAIAGEIRKKVADGAGPALPPAAVAPKVRKPTRPTRASDARRLDDKRQRQRKKQSRQPGNWF